MTVRYAWICRVAVIVVAVTILPVYAVATGGGATASATPEDEAVRQRQEEVRQQRRDARSAVEETTRELIDLSMRLDIAKAAAASNGAVLAQARATLEAARVEEARLAAELAAARASERLATANTTKAIAEHKSALVDVGRSARRAYMGQEKFTTLDVMLGSGSVEEYVERSAMLDRVGLFQRDIVARAQLKSALTRSAQARQAAAREVVRRASAAATDNRARAAQAERDQARLTTEAERLAQEEQALVVETASRRDGEMARLQVLDLEAAALEAEMARLAQAARDRAAREQATRDESARRHAAMDHAAGDKAGGSDSATLPDSAAHPPSATEADAGLLRPVSGRVTSSFGWRIHPIYGTRRMHRGTDFGNACGTPVRAAAGGSVVSAAAAGGSGNQIVLDHGLTGGDTIGTVYKHLQGYAVKSGQTVSRGQVIGFVGTTGASTGCHLHFEVYDDGIAVDPMTRL